MATAIPTALSSLDIKRFALRAAQLSSAKPIVAYWCNYWIVNQILSRKLHDADQECLVYTTTLMDTLESFKSENAAEDAVTDDVAGKAYVEQFGLSTFDRADNAVRANKASRQTADTFQAAATFLDLLGIWGPLDEEIVKKVKFAKYHALRIAKAVKAGEDPNLSNPQPEPEAEEVLPELDPNDKDVQAIEGLQRQRSVVEVPDEAERTQRGLAKTSSLDQSLHPSREPSRPPATDVLTQQPDVTDVLDESDRTTTTLANQSTLNESLHPSRAPSVPPQQPNDVSPMETTDPSSFYTNQNGAKTDVSPMQSPSRESSVGGNYFPVVPGANTADLPSAPITLGQQQSRPDLPHVPTRHYGRPISRPQSIASSIDPTDASAIPPGQSTGAGQVPQQRGSHGPLPPPPIVPQSQHVQHQNTFPMDSQPQIQPQGPSVPSYTQKFTQQPQAQPPPAVTRRAPAPAAVPPPVSVSSEPLHVDEESILRAQKHAKWAISALNFEDVVTARKELRAALGDLGG